MVQFTKPLFLLLLPLLVWYTYRFAKHSLADLSPFRSKLAFGLRLVILTMLVLALAGARIVRNASQQCVIFAIDASDSISRDKQTSAQSYVNAALKTMRSDQKAALVVFGGDASVEFAPSSFSRVDRLYSVPDRSATDISQALGLAFATFPEQCAKRIVLMSDGNETTGRAIEQAMIAGTNEISIDTVPLTTDLPKEVLLDKMICPSSVKIGEPFDIKITAFAKQPTVAAVRILRNGLPVAVRSLELPTGKSVCNFRQSITQPGGFEFKAILESADDTRAQNNVALAHTKVVGKPSALYIEGSAGQAKYLSSALRSSDIKVDIRNRSGIPNTMAELQNYDLLILSDVPAWSMSAEQMKIIQSAVKDLGLGFTMIGGENSFGAGGYFDTPIERALPVDMSIRKTKVLPTLSVVIVMDKSGSMSADEGGRQKIELANDAAASVVKLLQPIDKVGVIVCHSFPVAAVDLQMANHKGHIYDEISTIRAEGGGIAVFPSMKMAYDMISQSKTRQKHVILLADGQDCDEQEGVIPLTRQMANEKITVTTVAIGNGEHVPFLKATAYSGKGYFYLAERAQDLKAIFTKDVMMVSKSLVIEEPFVPRIDTSSSELSGIDGASMPPLLGYVVTSPKATGKVLAASHRKDPILATWQYGLGKSVAFTSDCKARWAARWLNWPGYSRFWAQALRSTMRKSGPRDFQTIVDVESSTGHVTVDAVDAKGNFLNFLKFNGAVVMPDLNVRPIDIEQTGPGRYEATFDARQVGSYVVNVVSKGQGQKSSDVNIVSIPYPPEYKDMTPNIALLKRIAAETSGRFDPAASTLFSGHFRQSKTYTDIWRLLTLLALMLLPVDVAVRRVAVSIEELLVLYQAARDRLRLVRSRRISQADAGRAETMSVLLRTKKEAIKQIKSDVDIERIAKVESNPEVGRQAASPPATTDVKPEPDSQADTTARLLAAKRKARKEIE